MDATFEKLSNIPYQTGTISIDEMGNLLLCNGDCEDHEPENELSYTKTIYGLIQDVNMIVNQVEDQFEVVEIEFQECELAFTVFNSRIYGVKKNLLN